METKPEDINVRWNFACKNKQDAEDLVALLERCGEQIFELPGAGLRVFQIPGGSGAPAEEYWCGIYRDIPRDEFSRRFGVVFPNQ